MVALLEARQVKKFSAPSIGLAVAVIAIYAFETLTKLKIPSEVAGAVGVLCTVVASALIPDDKED